MAGTVGRYTIKQELGRGGMAVVYHAHDPRFGRDVAIKLMLPNLLADADFRRRFDREARAIAALEHPAIVPVYDFGEHQGQPYLVMRYMPGGSLRDRLQAARGPLPPPEVLRLLQALAPALDFAHAWGLLHRDLKPDNILLDAHNHPYISDFGLAQVVEASIRQTGGTVGTPAYMSPEQVQDHPLDSRSDLYSLAIILFELLTGHVPYYASNPLSLAWKHVHEPIPSLRQYHANLPLAFEQVIRRALAKQPAQRYPTAAALTEAMTAATQSHFSRNAKAFFGSWWSRRGGQDRVGRERAGQELVTRQVPLQGDDIETKVEVEERGNRIQGWTPRKNIDPGKERAQNIPLKTTSSPRRSTSCLYRLFSLTLKGSFLILGLLCALVIFLPSTETTNVAFSPNGQRLASPSDNAIRIWSTSDGALLRTLLGHSQDVTSIAFSPTEDLLASTSNDNTIRLWRPSDGVLLRTLGGHASGITSVAFSPDGKLLASASNDNTIRIWRPSNGALLRTLLGHSQDVTSIAFSPTEDLLASASEDNTVRLWRPSNALLLHTLQGHSNWVRSVAFSPDGKRLASASNDNTIRIWRPSDGAHLRTLQGHTNNVTSVTFSPDGKLLASASQDNTIRVWRPSDGAHLRTLQGHTNNVTSVTFSPDGKLLASASQDNTIRIWHPSDGSLLRTLSILTQ